MIDREYIVAENKAYDNLVKLSWIYLVEVLMLVLM